MGDNELTQTAEPSIDAVHKEPDAPWTLIAMMPGALMYKARMPPGVPNHFNMRARQVHSLTESKALAHIPDEEIGAIVRSLTKTFSRSEYHFLRFSDLRQALDERRADLPGEVLFDELVDCIHFELQGFCGAVRTAVDEIIYLVARRHAVPPSRARRVPWEASDLISGVLKKGSRGDVPEVQLLRARAGWFATLNAYRNSFVHSGWQHGGGHFGQGDRRAAASVPAMNALLVPDEASLKSRKKPFEWTWNDGTTVDSVAERVHQGFDELLHELCAREWDTPVPSPGTAPANRHPNIIVALAKPAVVVTDDALIVPLFASVEQASAFSLFKSRRELELVELPASTLFSGNRAFTFTLAGLEENEIPAGVAELLVLVDPGPIGRVGSATKAAERASARIDELLRIGTIQPVSVPFTANRLFVWREPALLPWPTRLPDTE